jgi:riboflavin biosynthesis pyrimidine reductase
VRQLHPPTGASQPGDDPFAVYGTRRPAPADRPWVMANMVAGIDGSTAVDGRVGALSSRKDRALFVRLRSLADAVLIGAATVRSERYGPVRLPTALQAERREAGRPVAPPLAIVTRSLALDWESPLFAADGPVRPIVITAASAAPDALVQARDRADVIIAGDDMVDLGHALAELRCRGMTTVLTEGGPTLLGELMAGDLLDELCLTLAPLAGGDPLPVAIRPDGAGDLRAFELASVLEEDGHLFLRYLDRGAR